MLKHKFRLRTKDVRYLTKKKQYCTKGIFGFWRIKQYPNREYNQASCHIGVKLSKNATTRNKIRRIIMNYIRDKDITHNKINGDYYKIFINLNKNAIPQLVQYIESHQKSDRNLYFQTEFESAFTSFQSSLCYKK